MANIQIKIKNTQQIKRAFAKAPALMTRNLNIAIKNILIDIENKSKRNTPVDTGRLKSSHRTSFGNLRGQVGTNTEYDIFVHNGTRRMKARPYLAMAVSSLEKETDKEFAMATQKTLNRIGDMA